MKAELKAFLHMIQAEAGYSENTCQAYASDLQRFFAFLDEAGEGTPGLDAFNRETIRQFLEQEAQNGCKASTLFRRRASLRRFAKYLRGEGLIENDPTQEGNFLRGKVAQQRGNNRGGACLRGEEIRQVREAMEKKRNPRAYRDLAIFTLLLESGFSIGMLIALNLDDLDLELGRVRLPSQEGEPIHWFRLQGAAAALKRYLELGRPELNPYPKENALFISQMGGRMSRQGIWQGLRNWGEAAGLEQELTPRILRHSAALRMVKAGLTYAEVQRALGHNNPLSTRALVRRLRAANATLVSTEEEHSDE